MSSFVPAVDAKDGHDVANNNSGIKRTGESDASLSIHYTLEIVDPLNHLVKVTAHFRNVPDRSTQLALPTGKSFTYDVGSFITLSDVSASSEEGDSLEIAQQENTYTVSNEDDVNFIVAYSLVMNQHWGVKGPLGYLCETYLLSQGDWTFLAPVSGDASSIKAAFSVPSGWSVVTPWKKDGNDYVETEASRFYNATFAAGNFRQRTQEINGTSVSIAVDEDFDPGIQDHLDTLRYYINVDTDNDGVGNLQFAATYKTLGDTSKFLSDWTNYDFHSMDEFDGTASFLGDGVEMRIPTSFFSTTSINVAAGIWNTAKGEAVDSTAWMTVPLKPYVATLYVCSDGRCGGKPTCHATILSAAAAAQSGSFIKVANDVAYRADVEVSDKSLTFQGGWDATFKNRSGTTTLQGAPKARNGSVTLQEVHLAAKPENGEQR